MSDEKYKKITVGFVVQNYVTIGGKSVCVSQEFIAGDQVDRENADGEFIDVDTENEQYQNMEMKTPHAVGTDGLKFTCPSCESNRLECVENGNYSSEILNIGKDGDFDYGEIDASGEVDRFQCLECGHVLEEDDDEVTIVDNEEVVEWIEKNCKQE